MEDSTYDLIVIGAGPGGYVAAIRAAQLGMRVACVEKQFLGGTCLNIGCIPSKALLDSTAKLYEARTSLGRHGIRVGEVSFDLPAMMKRKDQVVAALTGGVGFLFRKNKVDHIPGSARLVDSSTVEVTGPEGRRQLKSHRILLATGSEPISLPALPFDGKYVIDSTAALALPQVPGRLVVIGAGAIGLELGSVWSRLGAQVLVIEFMDSILPAMDREMTRLLQRSLEKQGLAFRLGASAQGVEIRDDKVHLTWAAGQSRNVEVCDRVLVAVGRRPHTAGLGLDTLGVEIDRKGFVKVDAHYTTNIPGIYAIGDLIGGALLAHKAEEEGIAAVERMAGHAGHVNYSAVANVVYTHPELAQVGLTEEEARRDNREIRIGKFPFAANGRAKALEDTEGQVKVIADARTDRLLGLHILHARASDLIAEAALAMEFAASSEDLGRAVHAHPTLPEAIKEAALAATAQAIHI